MYYLVNYKGEVLAEDNSKERLEFMMRGMYTCEEIDTEELDIITEIELQEMDTIGE